MPKAQLHVVLWCDCTKLGVMQQNEINALAENAESLMRQNAERAELGVSCVFHPLVACYSFQSCINAASAEGSVLVLIPPLMGGSTCAVSMRPDLRRSASNNVLSC